MRREIIVLRRVDKSKIIDRVLIPVNIDNDSKIVIYRQFKKVYVGSTYHEIINTNKIVDIELKSTSTIDNNIETLIKTLIENGYEIIKQVRESTWTKENLFEIPIGRLVYHYKPGIYDE